MGNVGSIALKFELTDVAELLTSSLAPLKRQAAEQRIELRVDKLGDVPKFAVDREKLAWAVTSLVGNALRYVRRADNEEDIGGSIVVHVHYDSKDRELTIAVQDDGPGMSKARVQSLFERRSGEAHAAALALSLMRDVISAHGGQISVESRNEAHDHGTSISMVLPEARR
jgi:signal transduction histidine kinase